MPPTSSSASARRARCTAWVRVAPVTMSLASIESNAPETVSPSTTPVSTRTPGPLGSRSVVILPGRGQEAGRRVLAVDAELEGVPADGDLGVAERLARGDPQLLADEVDAGDLLGHRVLDLEAGVDLEERDGAVQADEELAGPGADVAGLAQDRLRRLDELGVLRVGEERRGRLLDELLVAALQRAVPGADDDDGAVGVREALGLHVPRVVEVALHEALAATEGGDRLADRGVEHLVDLVGGAGDLQAAAAAAERGLDRHRQAVLRREGVHLRGARDRVGGAGDQRGAGALGDVPRATPCRRARRSRPAAGRSTPGRRRSPPGRSRRSRRGSRSRGARRRRRSGGRRR